MAARALEFTILTAARTNETIGATWAEIDRQQRVWLPVQGVADCATSTLNAVEQP
jgi:hypothetical protein